MHVCVRTFVVIHSSVAVLMQQLLHAAERDGGEVARVFQLEEALQVGRRLTPRHVHALAVGRVQPRSKTTWRSDPAGQTVQMACMAANAHLPSITGSTCEQWYPEDRTMPVCGGWRSLWLLLW